MARTLPNLHLVEVFFSLSERNSGGGEQKKEPHQVLIRLFLREHYMKMKKLTSCYLHCKHTANLSENIIIVVSNHRFVVNRAIPVI